VNLFISPQSLNEYKDQGKTNEMLFIHLTCLAGNFNIFRRGEAVVFIILSLSHSCPNQDQQNLILGSKHSELFADMLSHRAKTFFPLERI